MRIRPSSNVLVRAARPDWPGHSDLVTAFTAAALLALMLMLAG